MNTPCRDAPLWSTSTLDGTTAPSPLDLAELEDQLDECNGARGPLFRLRTAIDAARRFVARRFVTTLAALLLCAAAVAPLACRFAPG